MNNTACDTQKEANKRELRKWARKSGKSTVWSIKTLTEAHVPAWKPLILGPRKERCEVLGDMNSSITVHRKPRTTINTNHMEAGTHVADTTLMTFSKGSDPFMKPLLNHLRTEEGHSRDCTLPGSSRSSPSRSEKIPKTSCESKWHVVALGVATAPKTTVCTWPQKQLQSDDYPTTRTLLRPCGLIELSSHVGAMITVNSIVILVNWQRPPQ